MYLETVESFLVQAQDLFRSNPLQTRYSIKYRHCDQKLVAKITDDVTCLQYKTDKLSDVKKLEQLNNILFDLMSGASTDVNMT
jgi:signal recognition particle subunit SRP9